MAIVIPSKNIYSKQNPKVCNNIIERIEVNAEEVVPANEFDTPIYDEEFFADAFTTTTSTSTKTEHKDVKELKLGSNNQTNGRYVCAFKNIFTRIDIPDIYIPKVKTNKYISKIKEGKDDEGVDNIKISANGERTIDYAVGFCYNPKSDTFLFDNANFETPDTPEMAYGLQGTDYEKDVRDDLFKYSEGTLKTNKDSIIAQHYVKEGQSSLSIGAKIIAPNDNARLDKVELNTWENRGLHLYNIEVGETTVNGVEYYKISQMKGILVECNILLGTSFVYSDDDISTIDAYAHSQVSRFVQKFKSVSVTVYGNTVGIDLESKVVYVNGKEAKKVHSIEGNELMQTSSYILPVSTKAAAIDAMYSAVQANYANGKENATIRCDISKYYLYNASNSKFDNYFLAKTPSELPDFEFSVSGTMDSIDGQYYYNYTLTCTKGRGFNKTVTLRYRMSISAGGYLSWRAITVEMKGGERIKSGMIYLGQQPRSFQIEVWNWAVHSPMLFTIGDEVIPMIYGANGIDRPMSTYKDGSQKVFKVVGTKVFYDGAVWQELSLQEVD